MKKQIKIENSKPNYQEIGNTNFIDYNKKLKERSKFLRNSSTLSEVLLWKKLKSKQMLGLSFNRQKPIQNFIVDFYCKELQFVIEIDGKSHDNEEKYIYDLKRDEILRNNGLHILHISDIEVKKNIVGVLKIIENCILNLKNLKK